MRDLAMNPARPCLSRCRAVVLAAALAVATVAGAWCVLGGGGH